MAQAVSMARLSARAVSVALILATLVFFLIGSMVIVGRVSRGVSEATARQEAVLLSKAASIIISEGLLRSDFYAASEQVKSLIEGSSLQQVGIVVSDAQDRQVLSFNREGGRPGARDERLEEAVYFDAAKTSLAYTIRTRFVPKQNLRAVNRNILFDPFMLSLLFGFGGLIIVMLGLSARFGSWVFSEINRIMENKPGATAQLFDGVAVVELERAFSTMEKLNLATRNKIAVEIAQQVAHDIRSPLAALEVAAGDVSHLPEDKRILIRGAVGRIRDIANSLLDRNRPSGAEVFSSAQEPAAAQLLSSLIESLVTEKRLQFRSRSRIEIEVWLDGASYGIFAKVQPVIFKRVLSNLVNNAVEAFGDGPGAVRVNMSASGGRALVSVQDNGKGIPSEVLSKLGQRGETHDKAGGSGLGLYHARISAESWGGALELSSSMGTGTTATLALPLAPAPEWFVSELVLPPSRPVVILDDDASIHQVWQGRLDALKVREHAVEIVHVSTPAEIRSWIEVNGVKSREALYLLDYELLGYADTGLSLAAEMAIGERTVLVTSRYEEPAILESCRTLKTRMIPKGLAGLVPIRIEQVSPATCPAGERWDAVLIDDDALARATWKIAASRFGKRFRAFSTAAEFMRESSGMDLATPVYIDADLGDGVKGDVESLKIHALGFGEIYLATGHEASKFSGLAHLRGVTGKEPPWTDVS